MAKKPPKKLKPEEVETEPGAWGRFTKAVKRMAPPKPKRPKPKREKATDK